MLTSIKIMGVDLSGFKFSKVKQIESEMDYDSFDYQTRDQNIKLVFQAAIRKLLDVENNPEAKLVIFVDDLDRCEQETIGKLLKSIKQYLATKHCVFVFGYDRHHVERALCSSGNRTSREIRSYMEKLFQTTVFLKSPTSLQISEYLKKRVIQTSFFYPNKVVKTELIKFLCQILDPNPRHIKGFLSLFELHLLSGYFGSKRRKEKLTATIPTNWNHPIPPIRAVDLKRLALITYLKLFHEPVYAVIENKPRLIGTICVLKEQPDVIDAQDYESAYMHLELRSHFKYTGFEKNAYYNAWLRNLNAESESKFINEVSEMQGRHQSHENFLEQFEIHFKELAPSTGDEVKKLVKLNAEQIMTLRQYL